MNKCESCVHAIWERDEFFGFWYVAGCKAVEKPRPFPKLGSDVCKKFEELELEEKERIAELLEERREL